jgi:hypothetical protein
MKKVTKKQIKDYLDTAYYYASGYKNINGGFAEVKIKEFQQKGDLIKVEGYVQSGKQDCGDGHSKTFTDAIDLVLKITKKGFEVVDNDKTDWD